jgi:hypothetical protein
MKNSSKILILAIFLVFICCVSAASASEDVTDDIVSVSDDVTVDEVVSEVDSDDEPISVSNDENLESVDDSGNESLAVQDEEQVDDVDDTTLTAENDNGQTSSEEVSYNIYVDESVAEDGDGSKENPYKTLDSVQSNYGDKSNNITINLFDGTYYIGSELEFASSNLNIKSEGNNVILKNLNNIYGSKQAITLISESTIFSMSNITFDYSNWTNGYSDLSYFHPVICGGNSVVTFNDCIFIGLNGMDPLLSMATENNEYIFNRCVFKDAFDLEDIAYPAETDKVIFNYCVFSLECNQIGFFDNEAYFNNSWFGQNKIPDYFFENNYGNIYIYSEMFYFTKYAIFNISENYLGNNKYEIIGKLTWNGTDNQEGMENFQPMTVTLSSDTGDIPKTAILENGTFTVIYNSTSSNHKVTAKLDFEEINLTFSNIVLNLDAPNIVYGDNQNITVTLPQKVNGAITVLVNDKPYYEYIEDSNSIRISITDILPINTYEVNVTFVDEENHLYGFNTTTFIVSKVSNYDFNATVTPTVYLGDNATVTLSLPDGATGNVTVKVGENEAKLFDIDDIISIDGFVAGNNVVNITFISDIYDTKSVARNVVASPKPTTLSAPDVTTDYNVTKDLVITLTSNNEVLANKTVNVIVGSINENFTTNAAGKVSIDISKLDPNTYVATIIFAGDELYNSSSTTATVVVKENIKTNITIPEITAGKTTTTTLKLPEKATGNITLTVDGKIISVVNLTNGSATITIPELTVGKHDVVISYSGDGNYAAFSQNSTVTVKEPVKPTPTPAPAKKAKQATKIVAKNKKFKAKTKVKKYTITLKTKAGKAVKKVQVTIKIGKKTYKAKTNAKGKATFKIKKLTKKAKYTATIKFKGNTNYKAVTKKVKITIKK